MRGQLLLALLLSLPPPLHHHPHLWNQLELMREPTHSEHRIVHDVFDAYKYQLSKECYQMH